MQNSDLETNAQSKKGDLALGSSLVVFAITVIALSQSIRTLGFGDTSDPGSKVFPIGLAIILGIGGVIEIWKSKGWRRKGTSTIGSENAPKKDSKTVLVILAYFAVYVFALPWLGFSLTTLVIASLMIRTLGNSWIKSVTASLILIAIVYLLFVVSFKVPLPGGILNLPF